MFELSDLRIFTAVVNEGGITKAAERLHRVQSNVTTRIRQLEQKLGVELFIREGKRLTLSPAGQIFLDYSKGILTLSAEAQNAVAGPQPMGIFRLGSMESTAAVRLPAPITEYNKRFPEVVIELTTGNPIELCTSLLEGKIEAALVAAPVADSRFDQVTAFEEEPVIVTSQNYPEIGKDFGTPETIIVFEHGCPHRKCLEEWFDNRKDIPKRVIELGSYHAILGCVLAGMGAALVPKSILTTFHESFRLRCHSLPKGKDNLPTLLIWRKEFKSTRIRGLEEVLSGNLAKS